MTEKKEEGFWYSEREPQYPIPIPNILTEEEAKKIYDLIRKKEVLCEEQLYECYVEYYRGCSPSRITDEILGNVQFFTDEWTWPGDFAEHYVLKHGVKPTDEFLKYINYGEF